MWRLVAVSAGDIILPGYPLVFIEEAEVEGAAAIVEEKIDPDFIRPDLQENYDRHALTLDENRPEAVEKRHGRGHRMPRENIAQLVDEGSFKEYWPLIVARQHQRHDIETLRKQTPADGLIAGIGTINAEAFGEEAARAMVTHYDYTVLAGTQGARNHYKLDRMFELAERFRLPVIHFGEGGGGRPGDDDVGQQKELMAIEDLEERQKFFDEKVERAYNDAKAMNGAMGGGLDDVIDPADTRDWIAKSLKRVPPPAPRTGKKRPFIDTW